MRWHLLTALALLAAAAGCPEAPYFPGDGPQVTGINPDWENGITGGQVVLGHIADIDAMTEEETALLGSQIVTISGDFSECEDPLVTLGNRNAFIYEPGLSALRVLTPPGPVSGGRVELAVVCEDGVRRVADAYDYVLGDAVTQVDGEYFNMAGEPARRLEDLYADEYGSIGVLYPAEPFINWPAPQAIGYVHELAAPRNAAFFVNRQPELEYGGYAFAPPLMDDPANPGGEQIPVPPIEQLAQVPALDWDEPPMGNEISAGPEIRFFRERKLSDATDPFVRQTRKQANIADPFNPDPNSPAPHDPQVPNDQATWLEVGFENDAGIHAMRYFRVAQWIGDWCNPDNPREGCGEGNDTRLNDTRLGVDFRYHWFTPQRPSREDLSTFPDAAPEHLAYLDCVDAGGTVEDCEADSGIALPSGTYTNVRVISSDDGGDQWPWLPDAFNRVMERIPSVTITEGAQYIDLPSRVVGVATLDDTNPNRIFYLAEQIGENAMPRGIPSFISYDGGFFRGERVPGKNADMEIPEELPEVGSEEYDEFPYITAPDVQFATYFNNPALAGAQRAGMSLEDPTTGEDVTIDFVAGGINYLIPLHVQLPIDPLTDLPYEFEIPDWRVALPGGRWGAAEDEVNIFDMTADGWADQTFMTAELSVRDLEAPGGFGASYLWRSALWAWAGEDYIVFPADHLATLPRVGDLTRPDAEDQAGDNLLGSYSFNVRRVASFPIGEEFRDPNGRMVFDTNAITTYYFRTEHSCFDSMDNDGDGLCDVAGCNDPADPLIRLPADPACFEFGAADGQPVSETATCQNLEDDDEDGLIDMADPDCEHPNDTDEGASCSDNLDNDGDGWVDSDDPGCDGFDDSYEFDENAVDPEAFDPSRGDQYSFLTECNDGFDDDGDGRVDAEDPGCESGLDDDEGDACTDGEDNNLDGWVDLEDLSCRPDAPAGMEPEGDYNPLDSEPFECSNFTTALGPDGFTDTFIDDDGDLLINAADPECAYGWDPSGEEFEAGECEDLVDNDLDGWVDGDDPQCIFGSETDGLPGGTCNNGEDDDGDGWVDHRDPDCSSGSDDEVSFAPRIECNDFADNDEDGFVDSEDPDCPTGKDIHEAPQAPPAE